MAHIHDLIDFTIVVFIVHKDKVLLIHHKELDKWLPIGGHIELDEDPEQALYREIEEECGLKVTIIGEKPNIKSTNRKYLITPKYLDIHDINSTHKHIAFVYFGKSDSDKVKLADLEHNEIKWFDENELSEEKYEIQSDIQFYAKEAFLKLSR